MDATIAPLPRAVMDYIAAFNLAAVCRYRDGRLGVARNPKCAEAAWWCEAFKAGPVIREAGRHSGDIPAAARALGVALTDHATVLARATAGVRRIEAGIAWTGVLHEFNQEYRRRRLEAQGRGETIRASGDRPGGLRRFGPHEFIRRFLMHALPKGFGDCQPLFFALISATDPTFRYDSIKTSLLPDNFR
jgi:hypothetical protein